MKFLIFILPIFSFLIGEPRTRSTGKDVRSIPSSFSPSSDWNVGCFFADGAPGRTRRPGYPGNIERSESIAGSWYNYQEPGFSIEFPKKPQLSRQSIPTAVGDIEMRIVSYEVSQDLDSNSAYMFISTIYPDSLITSDSTGKLARFFRASVDGAVQDSHGKLISEKVVSMEGFPGRDVKMRYANGSSIIWLRMFLVNNRGYIIQTMSKSGKEVNENANRFHYSFRLTK